MITYWYQADVVRNNLLDYPPDLTKVPGTECLVLGDLYYHCTPTQYQLWIWAREKNQKAAWKPVKCGHKRDDDRYLIITKTDKFPSWVQYESYQRALNDCRLLPVLATKVLINCV